MAQELWEIEAQEPTVLVRWNYLDHDGTLESEVWQGTLRAAKDASASTRVPELGLRTYLEVILTTVGAQGTVEFFCTLPEEERTVGYAIDASGALTVTMDGLPRFVFNARSWDSIKLNGATIRD
jgi:hypothetical protein